MAQRKRRNFTPEQKAEAVRLARESDSIAEAARSIGIGESTLGRWVNQAAIDDSDSDEDELSEEEMAELRKLRKENRRLRMERDFLKKAAAFFAKDSDRPSS